MGCGILTKHVIKPSLKDIVMQTVEQMLNDEVHLEQFENFLENRRSPEDSQRIQDKAEVYVKVYTELSRVVIESEEMLDDIQHKTAMPDRMKEKLREAIASRSVEETTCQVKRECCNEIEASIEYAEYKEYLNNCVQQSISNKDTLRNVNIC